MCLFLNVNCILYTNTVIVPFYDAAKCWLEAHFTFFFTSGLLLATEEIPDFMENIPKTRHCVSHLTLFCLMEGIS